METLNKFNGRANPYNDWRVITNLVYFPMQNEWKYHKPLIILIYSRFKVYDLITTLFL